MVAFTFELLSNDNSFEKLFFERRQRIQHRLRERKKENEENYNEDPYEEFSDFYCLDGWKSVCRVILERFVVLKIEKEFGLLKPIH